MGGYVLAEPVVTGAGEDIDMDIVMDTAGGHIMDIELDIMQVVVQDMPQDPGEHRQEAVMPTEIDQMV